MSYINRCDISMRYMNMSYINMSYIDKVISTWVKATGDVNISYINTGDINSGYINMGNINTGDCVGDIHINIHVAEPLVAMQTWGDTRFFYGRQTAETRIPQAINRRDTPTTVMEIYLLKYRI